MTGYAEHFSETGLRAQLLRECQAMARHALASGLKLPASLAGGLEALLLKMPQARADGRGAAAGEGPDARQSAAQSDGGQDPEIRQLAEIHGRLSEIVAPATPRAIVILQAEDGRVGFGRFFGALPAVRQMLAVSVIALLLLVASTFSPLLSEASIAKPLINLDGWELAVNQLFLLSAAAIGASFNNLFRMNRYIVEGTFDPKYRSTYWIRLVLGIIAGVILAELLSGLIYGRSLEPEPGSTGALEWQSLSKPVLAIVGGFSADVVYRILNRLVAAVETLVRGETRDLLASQEQRLRARFDQEAIQDRLSIASDLIALRLDLGAGATSEQLGRRLDEVLKKFLPVETLSEELSHPGGSGGSPDAPASSRET